MSFNNSKYSRGGDSSLRTEMKIYRLNNLVITLLSIASLLLIGVGGIGLEKESYNIPSVYIWLAILFLFIVFILSVIPLTYRLLKDS